MSSLACLNQVLRELVCFAKKVLQELNISLQKVIQRAQAKMK